MASTAELEDMVGYRLGLTISATSVPTTTDVQSWLWEAAKKIAKKADPKFIENLITTYVYSDDDILPLSGVTNYLRPVGLHIWYGVDESLDKVQTAEYLSPNVYTKASKESSAFLTGTTEFPIYTVSGSHVRWFPHYDRGYSDSGTTNTEGVIETTTEIAVASAAALAVGDYIRLDNESMLITAIVSNDLTVTRGQCGTDKVDHAADGTVYYLDTVKTNSTQVVHFEHITEPTDAAGLDNQFDELLVDYATMMAKLQDEELADANVFGQLFMAEFGGGAKQ